MASAASPRPLIVARKQPFLTRTDLLGYAFISPWIIGFLAFTLLPFLASLYLSFTDWRCTARPGKLYFTVFKLGRNGFELPAFKNDISKAYLLSDPAQENIPVTMTNSVRVLNPPRAKVDAMANVIVVEYAGDKVER